MADNIPIPIPNHLLSLPLVSVIACYDAFVDSGENKISAGIRDFLHATNTPLRQEASPDECGDDLFSQDKTALAKGMLRNLTGFIKMRAELNGSAAGANGTAAFCSLEKNIDFNLEGLPQQFWGALLIPFLGAVQTLAENQGIPAGNYLIDNLSPKKHPELSSFLQTSGVVQDGKVARTGKMLLKPIALGGYTQIAYSYLPYFLNLGAVLADPFKRGWDEEIYRMQPENAQASNKLISNIVGSLVKAVPIDNVTNVIDFGSGGGFFLLAMAKQGLQVAGVDISQEAIQNARRLFAEMDMDGDFYLGNLLNAEDLRKARKRSNPDVAFINYILHDIAGMGHTLEEGLEIVANFLRTYCELYAGIPLYISEAYFADAATLKADAKSSAILFSFLHAISPQYLFTRQDLQSLLGDSGFGIEREVIHTTHKDGSPANSTIIAVPD